MGTGGVSGGEIDGKIGNDIYTPLYIKYITNKDLLVAFGELNTL